LQKERAVAPAQPPFLFALGLIDLSTLICYCAFETSQHNSNQTTTIMKLVTLFVPGAVDQDALKKLRDVILRVAANLLSTADEAVSPSDLTFLEVSRGNYPTGADFIVEIKAPSSPALLQKLQDDEVKAMAYTILESRYWPGLHLETLGVLVTPIADGASAVVSKQ
jgi:hypothetical protein